MAESKTNTTISAKESESRVDSVNIRSEELQEVIGMIPHWIIRWGITIILMVIFVLLLGSWIFRYPDIVPATIVVTTKNPPATIVARISGKVQHLLVKENQLVGKEDYLAVLENTANLQHIMELKKKLVDFQKYLIRFAPEALITFAKNYVLGDCQNAYEIFLKSLADYMNYLQLGYYDKKVHSLAEQLQKQKTYCEQLSGQVAIIEEEWQLAKNQYERAGSLFKEGIISKTDLENARAVFLQKKSSVEEAKTSLIQAQIANDRLEQEILDLKHQDEQQKKELQLSLKQNYDNLKSILRQWEYSYVLQSPLEGVVTFTKFWSINQNVAAGEKVLSIVPRDKTEVIGRVVLPLQGSGKVKVGQKVRIKFANYPFMEFGLVWGEVNSKSLLAVDNVYALEVILPAGLKTSYGKMLEFNQEMQGTAEIITENKRLIERFLSPFKLLLSQNRGT